MCNKTLLILCINPGFEGKRIDDKKLKDERVNVQMGLFLELSSSRWYGTWVIGVCKTHRFEN